MFKHSIGFKIIEFLNILYSKIVNSIIYMGTEYIKIKTSYFLTKARSCPDWICSPCFFWF